LILFGLALSIPLIIFGSTLVLALLNRFPVLILAGAARLDRRRSPLRRSGAGTMAASALAGFRTLGWAGAVFVLVAPGCAAGARLQGSNARAFSGEVDTGPRQENAI
jgi:hypothetical protein